MNIEQERKYLRNMLGAKIYFIIMKVDELTECAVASRKKVMEIKYIKANCLGIDVNLRIDNLAYGYIQDINEFYSVGDVIRVKILEIDKENHKLKISAKELLEDSYKNIRIYFTE